ncbi:hypothetical protein NDU88_001016 [Pleurodeles waltl]|uniref:Uncharacterized protein n=1 Tax=Pleurodeles waltl TaxID=8319 RepID=A0AAV7UU48_PLEWA|nr:hypothetical protein NDU88_001016 [Pleurodeles waltl]
MNRTSAGGVRAERIPAPLALARGSRNHPALHRPGEGGPGQPVTPRTADPPPFRPFHSPGPLLVRGAPEQAPAPAGHFD